MRRSLSLRLRLAILVAGTSLPLIGFAAAIVYQHYRQDQRDAFARVLQEHAQHPARARSRDAGHRLRPDGSRGRPIRCRAAISKVFRARARAFLAQFPDHPSIVVGDREGRQVFNSSRPAGEPLPPRAVAKTAVKFFRRASRRSPNSSSAPFPNRPIVTVTVPVFRNGEVVYDLSFDPPLEIFQRIIEQQKPGEEWTISIFDQRGAQLCARAKPANHGWAASVA